MTIWWISVLLYFSRESEQQAIESPETMAYRDHLYFRTYKADRNGWRGPISTVVQHVNKTNLSISNANAHHTNGSDSDLGDRLSWDLIFKNNTFVETLRTTPDLPLWIFIVVSICLGIVFNLLVLRSILRTKCNGTAIHRPSDFSYYFFLLSFLLWRCKVVSIGIGIVIFALCVHSAIVFGRLCWTEMQLEIHYYFFGEAEIESCGASVLRIWNY